jgi:hypothetical protein
MESANHAGAVHYRTAVGGVNVFYREAGPPTTAVIDLGRLWSHVSGTRLSWTEGIPAIPAAVVVGDTGIQSVTPPV